MHKFVTKPATLSVAAILMLAGSLWGQELPADSEFIAAKEKTYSGEMGRNVPQYPRVSKWVSGVYWVDLLAWQALEENIESTSIKTSLIPLFFQGTEAGTVVNNSFSFKPAFEVGAGVNFDHRDIDLCADYIRYSSANKQSGSGAQFYPMQLPPGLLGAFLNGISAAGGFVGSAAPFSYKQLWELDMNIIDLQVGVLEKGKYVQWHPFAGLRADWISQTLNNSYVANFINGGGQAGTAYANQKTSSWAFGPRMGLDADFLMGSMLSFYGMTAADLLYTNYNWNETSNALVPNATAPTLAVNWSEVLSDNNISTVRAHIEMELGFRWSSYLKSAERNKLLQLSAGYGFQVFFDQNMFRHFTTVYEQISTATLPSTILSGLFPTPISSEPNGNLYIQGLRVEAKLVY